MHLLNLPSGVLFEIFEYLSYDEVSKKRLVCRRIDQICQHVLNVGFNKVIRQHALSFKRIKALLPRRESERRNHCLARHADILTSIETRISMLAMTYSKYMDMNLCCFIPGRVLDEIQRILRLVARTGKPLLPHEVLQELRDISSMALEHFDEKIANTLKKSITDSRSSKLHNIGGNHSLESGRTNLSMGGLGSVVVSGMGSSTSSNCNQVFCCNSIGQRVNTMLSLNPDGAHGSGIGSNAARTRASSDCSPKVGMHAEHGCPEAHVAMLEYKKLETEHKKAALKMYRLQQIQISHSRRVHRAYNTIADLTAQVIELKKRLEDVDAKNREISANIKQINIGAPAAVSKSTNNATESTDLKVQGAENTVPLDDLPKNAVRDMASLNATVESPSRTHKTTSVNPAATITVGTKRPRDAYKAVDAIASHISTDSSSAAIPQKKSKI